MTEVFQTIFRDHFWAGQSRSGPGSDVGATRPYRAFLERFLRDHWVRSVVDVGCGDWTSTRLLDWQGADYLGLDVVPELIEANRAQYGCPGVRFDLIDLSADPLPPADLVLCKDVLQHLPNDAVNVFLGKLPIYRWAILVNDVLRTRGGSWRTLWRYHREPMPPSNSDIRPGEKRDLKLLEPPFSLDATRTFRYVVRAGQFRWIKEVIVWENKDRKSDPGNNHS
jgi:SAM-dependent methyltransferase